MPYLQVDIAIWANRYVNLRRRNPEKPLLNLTKPDKGRVSVPFNLFGYPRPTLRWLRQCSLKNRSLSRQYRSPAGCWLLVLLHSYFILQDRTKAWHILGQETLGMSEISLKKLKWLIYMEPKCKVWQPSQFKFRPDIRTQTFQKMSVNSSACLKHFKKRKSSSVPSHSQLAHRPIPMELLEHAIWFKRSKNWPAFDQSNS